MNKVYSYFRKSPYLRLALSAMFFLIVSVGCGSTGNKFDESKFGQIMNGKTTQEEVLQLFGEPYQKGVENGHAVWIYEYNEFGLFEKNASKDIYLIFNEQNIVQSHQFMSN